MHMLRRDFIQAIVQAILFAIFGRFAKRLPAYVVEDVEKVLFRGGFEMIYIRMCGFEITEDLARKVRESIPNSELQKLLGPESSHVVA